MSRATAKKILSNPRPVDFFENLLNLKEGHTFCLKTKRARDEKGRFVKNPRPFSPRIEGWETKIVLETKKDKTKSPIKKKVPLIKFEHKSVSTLFHFSKKEIRKRRHQRTMERNRAA